MMTQKSLQEQFVYSPVDGKLYRFQPDGTLRKVEGTKATGGHLKVRVNNKNVFYHRVVFLLIHGWLPKVLDHINCQPADNRVENLRPADSSSNGANRPIPKNNRSGFKGVVFRAKTKKWQALIKHNMKPIHLGYFTSPIDAAKAYNDAAIKLFGQFANINKLEVA